MKLEPITGGYIQEYVKDAKDICRNVGLECVTFVFNGVIVSVNKKSVVQDVVDDYYKRNER